MQLPKYLGVGEMAVHFGTEPWRIKRLYQRKLLPDDQRIAGRRVVAREDLPKVAAALAKARYRCDHCGNVLTA